MKMIGIEQDDTRREIRELVDRAESGGAGGRMAPVARGRCGSSDSGSNCYPARRESDPKATHRKFRIVQTEGARQVECEVDVYSLDVAVPGTRHPRARGLSPYSHHT